MSRPSPRRIALAVALAVVAHLLALLALGWGTPTVETREDMDDLPHIELSLVRIRPQAPAAPAPAAGPAKAPPAAPASPGALASAIPATSTPLAASSPLAAGPADCEPEDLPLLTEAERALCHNQIEVDKGRRLARDADARAAKQVAEAKAAPRIDNIPADKRAEYDAIAQANAPQSGLPPMERGPLMGQSRAAIGIGASCNHVRFPLLGGVETNPNLFAKKHKQERPSHGSMTCSAHIGG